MFVLQEKYIGNFKVDEKILRLGNSGITNIDFTGVNIAIRGIVLSLLKFPEILLWV